MDLTKTRTPVIKLESNGSETVNKIEGKSPQGIQGSMLYMLLCIPLPHHIVLSVYSILLCGRRRGRACALCAYLDRRSK